MSFVNRLSLRTKVIAMVFSVITFIGVGSIFSMKQMARHYEEETYAFLESAAQTLADSIAAQFYERYGDVQAFAVNESLQSMNGKAMQSDLDSYVALYMLYDVILVVDMQGNYVGSNSVDLSGKPIAQRELSQLNYGQAPWFKAAVSGQFTEDSKNGFAGTYFEELHYDPLLKVALGEDRVTTGFTALIKDANGKPIGVITNRANSKWIDAEMQNTFSDLVANRLKKAQVMLVNKDGSVLSEVRPNEKGDGEVTYEKEKNFAKRNIKDEHEAGAEILAAKHGALISVDAVDSDEDIVGFSLIHGPKWPAQITWKVMVQDDIEEVLEGTRASINMFYFIFMTTTSLALAFAVYFGITLSKSVSALTVTLTQNSSDLSHASGSIANSSVELSESSTEQAAALQETVAAVDEISAMVDKNAESASRSKDASNSSREAAMKGRQNVDLMIQAMNEISDSNNEVTNQMSTNNVQLSEITKLINDIGSKTKVINEIVFQTKLLSFNASVEAARAGEYGKGFAVVAEEVGNLAQMSGNAAKEITSLLEESVQKVETIVRESKAKVESLLSNSKQKVEAGFETAKSCNESLEEILGNVSSVDTLVSEIAAASQEQAAGIREIAKAVGQMEEVTQRNSSLADASSSSASQLKTQSVQLKSVVTELVVLVRGGGAEVPSGDTVAAEPTVSRKVLAMPRKEAPVRSVASDTKKVASGESIPSSNDPGFEE